jgi:hypothetical protein
VTVVALWTASPTVRLSVIEYAEPAVVIAKSVSTIAGTPAVTLSAVNPPIAPEVVVPETVVLGVTLLPVTL